jgi:hypothetical protein
MIELGCKATENEPRTGKPRHQEYRNLNMTRDHSTREIRTDDVTERERSRRLMRSQISSRYSGEEPIDPLRKGLTR